MKQKNKNNKEKRKRMVIFGTFFNSEMGGIKDLLVLLGKGKKVEIIDKEYQRRKFSGPWGLKELAELYKGFSLNELKSVSLKYCRQNLLKGLKEASLLLKERGFLTGAISSNPQFLMDVVKDILLLDFAVGTELEFKKAVATGLIKKEVNRYTKTEILKIKRKKYEVDKKDVITLGRLAPSHLPLTKEVGKYIGFVPTMETMSDVFQMIMANKNLKKLFSERSK